MKIIALGHRRRVGKDIAAEYLVDLIKKEVSPKTIVKHQSFAEPLKTLAFHLWGWTGLKQGEYYNEINADEREKKLPGIKKSPRKLWIELGLNIREIYTDTWVDMLLENTEQDICVISDLRFLNELEKIRRMKGLIIKVIRPSIIPSSDPADCALAHWKDWDHTIINDGTLEEYYGNLRTFFKETVLPYIKEA